MNSHAVGQLFCGRAQFAKHDAVDALAVK